MGEADGSGLIGREADVRELIDALDTPGVVCLVGAAGLGKTTLSRHVAARLAERGRSVAWCDASGAGPLALVADVARAAGVALPAGLPLESALRGAARALPIGGAIVLDDVDLRVPELASTLVALERLAPSVAWLVTARGSADLGRVHRLRALSLSPGPAGVLESECGRAWQRAVHRRGGRGSMRPADAVLLWEILSELDGLPLAIELAAARSGVLSPAEILAALRKDRFELLRSDEGHTTAPLERAIGASWSALERADQQLLETCALFPGGFSVALLERVGETHVVDRLARLVDRSLVTRRRETAERTWLALPSSVRAFAARELDREGGRAARESAWRRAYADELEACTASHAERLRSHARLEEERENLLALTTRTTPADATSTLRALAALSGFYWFEGLGEAQLATLASALALAPEATPGLVARALALRGRVLRRRGDPSAEGDLARAIDRAEEAGERETAALAARELAWLTMATGRFGECEAVLARAETNARGSAYAEAWITFLRSQLDGHHGRLEEARARLASAMHAFRRMQARFDETLVLIELSEQYLMTGEHERARRTSETGFALATEMGPSGAALAANFLVMLAAARLEAQDRAGTLEAVEGARTRARALGDSMMDTAASAVEVLLHWGEGEVDVARALVSEVIPDLELRRDRIWGGFFVALEGAMAAEQGHEVEAERALARAVKDFPEASSYHAALRLCGGHLELLRARRAIAAGKSKEATHHLNLAVAIAAAARARGPNGAAPDTERRFETRLVLRVLDESIAHVSAALAPPEAAGAGTLALARDGAWLEVEGPRVSLDKRPVLRRLLLELARARIARPGVAVDAERLIAAGWPGERMMHASAISRLRMAISRLRASGLGAMLRTEGDGYYLDETVRVAFVDE